MRRATLALALGLAWSGYVLPQEAEPRHESREEQHDPWIWWKWLNFGILAAGLGYLIGKSVPALFDKRKQEIQQALEDAAVARKDAEARAVAIEQRFAGLKDEIAKLRETAHAEMAGEGERIGRETTQHLQKIQEQSAQEITLLTRAARDELRRYSAALALDMAEQRLGSRVTPEAQSKLADGFLQDLRHRARPSA